MNCAGMWTNGEPCPIQTSGRSPLRRLAYYSIGGITTLAVSALSSARWRRRKLAGRELVPGDMLDDVNRAKMVIMNYHPFKRRERIELSKDGRSLLQGWGELLREDKHCQHSVSPAGVVSFVLTNGSILSNTSGEGESYQAIIEFNLTRNKRETPHNVI